MKINFKKKIQIPASLKSKRKFALKNKVVGKTVEIPDRLSGKTIAVIDEILDRTYDDWEERSWSGLTFPLVPFPFFEKSRLPENEGTDDYWISHWLDTDLLHTITERTEIIEKLNELGMIKINCNPVLNITSGIFDGDSFEIEVLDRNKLYDIRKKIIEEQKKKKGKESKKHSWINKQQMDGKNLFLNQFGDLYKEPKSKYCYASRGGRYKILKHFVDNKIYSFFPTKEIAINLGKSENNLRKEINKINPMAKDRLKIKDNIIEGREGFGYRLNPNRKIIKRND